MARIRCTYFTIKDYISMMRKTKRKKEKRDKIKIRSTKYTTNTTKETKPLQHKRITHNKNPFFALTLCYPPDVEKGT